MKPNIGTRACVMVLIILWLSAGCSTTIKAITPVKPTETSAYQDCIGMDYVIKGAVISALYDSTRSFSGIPVRLSQISWCSPTAGKQTAHTAEDGSFAFKVYVHDTDTFDFLVKVDGYNVAKARTTGFDYLAGNRLPVELILQPIDIPTKTSEPTLTDSPQPEAGLLPGFKDYTIGDFMLSLPESWFIVDLGKDGFAALLGMLAELDSDWAQNMASMMSPEQMQEMGRLFAMDNQPAGNGYATAVVMMQTLPYAMTADMLCGLMPNVYKEMGVTFLDAQCGLEINQLQAARFTVEMQEDSMAVRQYQYMVIADTRMWVLSLGVDVNHWERYEPTFASIAETFRLNE